MLLSLKTIPRADPEKFCKVENITDPHTHIYTHIQTNNSKSFE